MFSIIIPTYREAANLSVLIPRVAAAMGPTGRPYEIIVVDDESRDGTEQVMGDLAHRAPARLVVAGASAGGFGALIDYDAFRQSWPGARAYLVDDSGPPLGADAVSPLLLQTWFASWRLDRALDPVCGTACHTDLSAQLTALSRRFPHDRLALLSSLQDQVIAGYYLLSGPALEQELLRITAEVIAPTPNVRAFLVPGNTHTMLGDPTAFSQGISLLSWLDQQAADDPAWSTRQP